MHNIRLLNNIINSPEYSAISNQHGSGVMADRLGAMAAWRDAELTVKIDDRLPLFYPFSGPDFLHAATLFPNASEYLFFAQERPGKLPDLAAMKKREIIAYLNSIQRSLRDLHKRSYFITTCMDNDLNTAEISGVLPLLVFFMARSGQRIHDLKHECLVPDGTFRSLNRVAGTPEGTECLTIRFSSRHSETIKTLRYFCGDALDEKLNAVESLKNLLNEQTPVNTYIKAASYLLHDDLYAGIRGIILNNSAAVLQDDSGVPYRFFEPEKWERYLYGVYEKPIRDFPSPWLTQHDLKRAYDSTDQVKHLPFSLGYHWRSGRQNQMLFARRSS